MAPEHMTIAGALLVHAGAFVWWASRINTLVGLLVSDVNSLKETKDDHSNRLTRLEGRRA